MIAISTFPGQTVTGAINVHNAPLLGGTPQVTAGDGVAVSNITVTSPTTLTARFTVPPTASPGPRSVTVSGFGPLEATLPNGFRVQ